MLLRIHQLLGLQPAVGMKAIQVRGLYSHYRLLPQVCYKHPELLKQARETCIALRDSQEEGRGKVLEEGVGEGGGNRSAGEVELGAGLGQEGSLLSGLEEKLGKVEEEKDERLGVEVADRGEGEVTSIVYTDEGGREQSLVGKIVYQTDDSGQSNIIIQVGGILLYFALPSEGFVFG